MAKSREELRRELQASLGLGDTPKASKPAKAAKPQAAPVPADNPFSRVRVTTAATLGVKSNGVAVMEHDEDESEVEEFVEEEVGGDEPDSTPAEDFVDAVTGLVDYIADNRTALKEFLLRLR